VHVCTQRRYSCRCRLSDSTGAALARDAWYHQRRLYRQLRHRKASDFCRLRIESDRSDPKRLWRSVDRLLGRGRLAASTSISANEYCQYFANSSPGYCRFIPPDFTPITSSSSLSGTRPLKRLVYLFAGFQTNLRLPIQFRLRFRRTWLILLF